MYLKETDKFPNTCKTLAFLRHNHETQLQSINPIQPVLMQDQASTYPPLLCFDLDELLTSRSVVVLLMKLRVMRYFESFRRQALVTWTFGANRHCDQVEKAACRDWATNWAIWGSNPGTLKTFYPEFPDRLWGPQNVFQRLLCQELSSRGVHLTIHFHLVTRLRMRGAIPPGPLHTYKAWAGKIFP